MIAAAISLWLGVLMFVEAPAKTLELAFPKVSQLLDLKAAYLSSLGKISDSEALVAGLAMGERELLSDSAQESMREVSLTHLVAVSGANLAIVMGAIWFLLGYLGFSRNLRFVFSGLGLIGYVLLVGPEPSVLRAGAMAIAVLLAMALGRGTNPLHALALAIVCLLFADQSLASDLGFALSVVATAGLLIGAQPIAERLQFLSRPLALALGAGIATQIFTLPVMVLIQPGFPIFGIIANLIVEPVVAPVTVLGIVSVLLIPFSEALSHTATSLAGFGTSWILVVAQYLSGMSETRLHIVGGLVGQLLLWLLVLLISVAAVTLGKPRKLAVAGLAATSMLILTLSAADVVRHTGAMNTWHLMVCDVGQGDALLVRDSGFVALIDVGRDPELINDCLLQAGINRIDLLILTHYDQDHVGGISGLNQMSIGKVLVSGFEDDRPVVGFVESFLRDRGVAAEIALAGQVAKFGNCRFHLLGPKNPLLAVSSNDASITSLFDCPNYQLLSLADSGELAQQSIISSLMPIINPDLTRVVKVAHHGSGDQNRELYEAFRADIAIYSVGSANSYGHPTQKALSLTQVMGSKNLRTDLDGAISMKLEGGLEFYTAGKLST